MIKATGLLRAFFLLPLCFSVFLIPSSTLAQDSMESSNRPPPPGFCGDGIQQSDEACDEGSLNGTASSECSADCGTFGSCPALVGLTIPDSYNIGTSLAPNPACAPAWNSGIYNLAGNSLGALWAGGSDVLCAHPSLTFEFQGTVDIPMPSVPADTTITATLPSGLSVVSDRITGTLSLLGRVGALVGTVCQQQVSHPCCDHVRQWHYFREILPVKKGIVFDITVTDPITGDVCSYRKVTSLVTGGKTLQHRGDNCTPTTPIALDLSQEGLENTSPTFVSFKLHPQQEGKTLWYGSEFAPLLIWDPKDSGKVVDGQQLFGSWSFGKTFSNGFEALQTLDKDRNGKLEGFELINIKLWYDKNKNGVSDSGELKSLGSAGIVSVATSPSEKSSREFYDLDFAVAEKGVTYDLDGEITSGRMVDWGVPPITALSAKAWNDKLITLRAEGYLVLEYVDDPKWHINSNTLDGYLVFKVGADGKIEGERHGAAVLGSFPANKSVPDQYAIQSNKLSGEKKGSDYHIVIAPKDDAPVKRYLHLEFTQDKSGNFVEGKLTSKDLDGDSKEVHKKEAGLIVREAKTLPPHLQ